MKPDLESIRERCEKATEGPWDYYHSNYDTGTWVVLPVSPSGEVMGDTWVADEVATADADFIAHSRQDIPALLAYIERLERVAEAAKARIAVWTRETYIA